MELLKVSGLGVAVGNKVILDGIDFSLFKNELLIIGGPNGAGKSTLVRAITNAIGFSGAVTLFDKDIKTYKNCERAKHVAVLSQMQSREFGYTAEEVVRFGLYNRKKSFFDLSFSKRDGEAVENAMEITGVKAYAKRSITNLSGGELQRVYLAQALTQNPDILILDEPSAGLDPLGKEEIMQLLHSLHKNCCKTVIMVSHNMDEVAENCTSVAVFENGKIACVKPPEELFEESERLINMGLDVPVTVKILNILKQKRPDIKTSIFDNQKFADEIKQVTSNK